MSVTTDGVFRIRLVVSVTTDGRLRWLCNSISVGSHPKDWQARVTCEKKRPSIGLYFDTFRVPCLECQHRMKVASVATPHSN